MLPRPDDTLQQVTRFTRWELVLLNSVRECYSHENCGKIGKISSTDQGVSYGQYPFSSARDNPGIAG